MAEEDRPAAGRLEVRVGGAEVGDQVALGEALGADPVAPGGAVGDAEARQPGGVERLPTPTPSLVPYSTAEFSPHTTSGMPKRTAIVSGIANSAMCIGIAGSPRRTKAARRERRLDAG